MARQAARLKQDELASRIGCSRQSIMSWENERSVPSVVYLRALLSCLADRGVTIAHESGSFIITILEQPAGKG